MPPLTDFSARALDGTDVDPAAYAGRVGRQLAVSLAMSATVAVNGRRKGPPGGRSNWNVTGFLDDEGRVAGRLGPRTEPAGIGADVDKALAV